MAFGSGSGKRRRSMTESAAAARYNASENEDIDEGEEIDAGAGGEDTRVIVNVDCDDEEVPCLAAGKINPLLAEITMIGGEKGKNDGGTKQWRCNHCQKTYKSSLTRVRVHLLGAQPGKKAQIQRCPVLLNDAAKYRELRDKVKELDESAKSGHKMNNSLAQCFCWCSFCALFSG
ncbi:unnamed protein product [Urochloa humidicola]